MAGHRAHVRLSQVAAALQPASVAAKPVGEFDKHDDNHLRISELFDFKGKVALVTGGSIGIGRMIAEGLAVNGCKVYITSRKLDACEITANELEEITGGEVIPFASDLSGGEGCQWLQISSLLERASLTSSSTMPAPHGEVSSMIIHPRPGIAS